MYCYYCKSKNIIVYFIVNNKYSVYTCRTCFLTFTSPQPVSSLIENINDSKYDSKEEMKSRLAIYDQEYKKAKRHIREILQYKNSGKFIDIGCSYGICVRAAKDTGFEAYGVEPARKAARYGKKQLHVNIFRGTLHEAKLKSNSFDVVTLYDVLEHIPDLKGFLGEIQRILKPKGLIVIQSPNIESYAARILKTSWNWLLVPNHLWHFSCSSLSYVLQKNGFSVKKCITEDNVYDFASNLASVFSSSGFFYKLMKKVTYKFSYIIILIGTTIWSRKNKGGILRIYAIKK